MAHRDSSYLAEPLDPSAVARPGWMVLEFGTGWCGHCIAARPVVDAWTERHSGVEHLRIEDGPGRTLGRRFRVKLWPTLVLLRDGNEVARAVRPTKRSDLELLDAAFD